MRISYLKYPLLLLTLTICKVISAQCPPVTTISGNLTVSSSMILSGTYSVSGTFQIPSGVTVFVGKYSSGACGKFEVFAKKIIVDGVINADDAGYLGGNGGAGGNLATSLTGDAVSITTCSNKDNTGHVSVEGGKQGGNGNGPGAGLGGATGQNGSGPKQQCLNTNDESGMIGSGGGAGGGGGGSYGGLGNNGLNGGYGSNSYTATGVNVSTGFVVVQGTGGTGGNAGPNYGTISGSDIDLGSGGAGAGGGGKSYINGNNGSKGGNGGGMVKLFATDTLIITGVISANGSTGLNGGSGGDGGQSPKCCSDGCDDCGEATLSCGAGGGSGSGGGSGGGIYLESQLKAIITGNLISKGGNGGSGGIKGNGVTCNYSATFCGTQALTSGAGNNGNTGGAGGGGRIKVFVPSCLQNTITPTIDVNGGTGNGTAAAGSYSVICLSTSIFESFTDYGISIFPNPADGIINIKLKQPVVLSENSMIELYDITGNLISSQPCTLMKDETQWIDITGIRQGVYLIRLRTSEFVINEKFIKN